MYHFLSNSETRKNQFPRSHITPPSSTLPPPETPTNTENSEISGILRPPSHCLFTVFAKLGNSQGTTEAGLIRAQALKPLLPASFSSLESSPSTSSLSWVAKRSLATFVTTRWFCPKVTTARTGERGRGHDRILECTQRWRLLIGNRGSPALVSIFWWAIIGIVK